MALTYGLLALAIVCEVTGTLALKASSGFSRPGLGAVVAVSYSLAFVLLSLVLKRGMDVAVAYAIWSALGIVAIAVAGTVLFDEHLSKVQIGGLALLVTGILSLELGAHTAD